MLQSWVACSLDLPSLLLLKPREAPHEFVSNAGSRQQLSKVDYQAESLKESF